MNTTKTTQNIRVKSIHAKSLFGIYDHDIYLNEQESMTIVHGPNGVGKTVLFKLTNALLNPQASMADLLKYPYQVFKVEFTNQESITVSRKGEHQKRSAQIRSTIENFEEHLDEKMFGKLAERLERRMPIQQIRPDRWIDPATDEVLDAFEVISRFGAEIDDKDFDLPLGKFSDWRRIQKSLPQSYMIEAQRLIKLRNPPRGGRSFRDSESTNLARDTVMEYSSQLRQRIDQTLAQYGRESQLRDQSFPERLLSSRSAKSLTKEEISTALTEITNRQLNYQKLGLIGEQSKQISFDGNELEDEVSRKALTVYVQDINEKLSVLDDLATRITLLLHLVNDKFSRKKVVIHPKTHELTVQTDKEEQIPVSALSSGEQHQIVLAYDLLFRIEPNTLVLIDEPELSLHVNWQERFLSDLRSVIDVVHFDALIATHSPYIINGRNDLMVNLSTTNSPQG